MAGYDKPCIACGTLIGYGSNFCPVCGRLSPFYDACPACAAEIERVYQRCPSCGRELYVTCPSCGQRTFAADRCDVCQVSLLRQCGNPRCGMPQFFMNTKCTACGKKIK